MLCASVIKPCVHTADAGGIPGLVGMGTQDACLSRKKQTSSTLRMFGILERVFWIHSSMQMRVSDFTKGSFEARNQTMQFPFKKLT
jgi:hypothetical protein